METANGYIDNHLSATMMNKSYQQIHNSPLNQPHQKQDQCFNQLNQLNQLSYIDDDYSPQSNYPPSYYNDLKLNDDLQQLNLTDNNCLSTNQYQHQHQQIENISSSSIKHWSKLVYECREIQLFEKNIAGGSDYGQLIFFYDSGDIILEIDSIKISGFTRDDVYSLIRTKQYHCIKAVSSSSSFDLPIDLKDYLSRRFARGSIDHELQSTIRDNIYVRTVPCTTRPPKPNEVDGVDYKFVSKAEFLEMERSNVLLESGFYNNNYYGTPLPLSNSIPINYLSSNDQVDNKIHTSINGRLSETSNLINSINNSTMMNSSQMISSKELLLPIDQFSPATSTATTTAVNKKDNNNPLQQEPAQLSAMALKRRRNRSNIAAIDSNTLPVGWELIKDDHVHGIYYIDHINKRTQYERPYEVELTKATNGFGFTLSYLNSGLVVVKTIIPDGPASNCGIIQPGDILVSVSNVSVSCLNHSDIAKLFSTFEVGDRVKLTFARSLQMPTELIAQQTTTTTTTITANENEFIDDEFDLISVDICKGQMGFGFTISDATNGQKVKKILDIKRCNGLQQGDLLMSVNGIDLSNLNHIEVVEVLKNHCLIGEETRFTVKRFKNQQQTNKQLVDNDDEAILTVFGKTNANCLDDKMINYSNSNINNLVVPKNFNTYGVVIDEQQQQQLFNQNSNNNATMLESNPQQTKLSDNLIAELKANLAQNSNGSSSTNNNVNNNELISQQSTTANLMLNNNYSTNFESQIDQSNNNNVYSVIENSSNQLNNNDFMNSTMIMDNNQTALANEEEFEYFRAFLNRSSTNYSFGFRIVGGSEENRPVTIGSIVIGGVAHQDGILKAGDEIISINDQNVMNASHHYVVKLMSECGANVSLLVRRRKDSDAFDVILNRDPITDGYGFIIIGVGSQSLIGRIIDNSPASRCGRLKIRDKIIAVNNVNITQMNHPDIVNMIKESGHQLKLRIIPADCYIVELVRGTNGFGFSIRGGSEFGMAIFILRIAAEDAAYSLLNIGDEIIEINQISTANMTHAEAVLLISQSGASVKLKLRRRDLLTTTTSMTNFNAAAALQHNNQPVDSYAYYEQLSH